MTSRADRITATYLVDTSDWDAAGNAIARGQSVGNPTKFTKHETKAFLSRFAASYTVMKDHGCITVSWPVENFANGGMNYLMSVLLGGQMDIDLINKCVLWHLDLGSFADTLPGPRYGIEGIRDLLGVYDRPLICGIIKPKIGMTPKEYAQTALELHQGGCDVIKEDEILLNQPWCPAHDRLNAVQAVLHEQNVLYLHSATYDDFHVMREHYEMPVGRHLNLWGGLGQYLTARRGSSLPLFFQKSGDKVWTTGLYSLNYAVLCQLVSLAGCDFAHVGMFGGYLSDSTEALHRRITALQRTIPSFSCGMEPQLVEPIVQEFGVDVMLTSGGWVCAHPDGPRVGAQLMRKAVEDVCGSPA